MDDALYAGDRLLDAWLNLTSTLWNTRLVSSMTYNEAHVLGLLLRHEDDPAPMTATALIARTHLLKSQMNKVLTALEGKGYITRARAQTDRRLVLIRLTPEGDAAYRSEHERVEALLARLVGRIGEAQALTLAGEINELTGALSDILASGFAAAKERKPS